MKESVLIFLYLVLIAAVIFLPVPARSESETRTARQIKWLVSAAPRHPMNRATQRAAMASRIDAAADAYQIPRELVLAIVYRESSFRDDVFGPAGEAGLMQVHPATAAGHRCKLETPEQQLDCGCRILRKRVNKCKSLRGGLVSYGSRTGQCNARPGSKLAKFAADRFSLMMELEAIR